MDLAIIGGEIITEHGRVCADVGIAEGRIVALGAPGTINDAAAQIDARGMLVLPGVVDVHFHSRTPAYPERGDFYTETRAAAAGGVTTVFEMPISKPGCATPETFRNRRRLIEEQAIIDVALYGAPGTLNRDDVLTMAAEGAISYKIFMHRPVLGREDEFVGICLTDDEELCQTLALVKETGRRLVVHCESDSMLEAGLARIQAEGRTDLQAHMDSRPPVVEAVGVARVLTMAEDVGTPVHIAHLSSAAALDVIRRYQRDGVDVSAETCPHYLFFTEEDYLRLGPYGKYNPPIRSAEDQQALWQGIADGTITVVTSDHGTYLAEEKERGRNATWLAPSGGPGVQTLLPMMMTAALEGRLSVEQVVRLTSAEPARLFGLSGRKGTVAPGADADICIYDPRPHTVMTRDRMWSKARDVDKLHEGLSLQGEVAATISAGQIVFRQGEILASAGSGRFISPG
ncbi:MAG: amidohydrolase family protein [Anaerolineae bacterium]|nr:amidohydrolase family protein [Anaerolineae bacterium]NIN99144.1 amidohydrolase family protein [Anaerolineae bacterium]NIQ81985.1 amidohydrolase family protein [Anaerolineae bacterium]